MNLKQIDAAAAAYATKLEAGDEARLAFFRKLWDVQAGCAEHASAEYEVPAAKELLAWYKAGEPVFAGAPATVDAEAFAQAWEKLMACAAEHGSFPADVREAFERTKWDRVVKASTLEDAGCKPEAYLAGLADVLVDDGMAEGAARTAALVAALALRAQLEGPAAEVMAALQEAGAVEPHPLQCPVCGCAPALARVGSGGELQGRTRSLHCQQCGTTWDFERVRCARCGTQNQSHLHYYNVEGDEGHRIATCDECGGYMRTVYSDDVLAPFSYEVEDVVMARLDAIAQDPTFAGGTTE